MKTHILNRENSLDSDFVKAFNRARKTLIITGAGISVSGGIPDFRSEGGLYDQIRKKYPELKGRGQDLFDANVLFSASNAKPECFFSFMGLLSQCIAQATVTPTHYFMTDLKSKGKLLRIYTQNIDGLEEKAGLSCGLSNDTDVIQLHGSLHHIICTICNIRKPMTKEILEEFLKGQSPPCKACEDTQNTRASSGQRRTAAGHLRPDVVLYNETHRDGDEIRARFVNDIKRRPDFVLVMGTSLKIPGCRQLVKAASKAARTRQGSRVVYVNRTPPSVEWESVFDFYIEGDCDSFVTQLMQEAASQKKKRAMESESLDSSLPSLSSSQVSLTDSPSFMSSWRLNSDPCVQIDDENSSTFKENIHLLTKMENIMIDDNLLRCGGPSQVMTSPVSLTNVAHKKPKIHRKKTKLLNSNPLRPAPSALSMTAMPSLKIEKNDNRNVFPVQQQYQPSLSYLPPFFGVSPFFGMPPLLSRMRHPPYGWEYQFHPLPNFAYYNNSVNGSMRHPYFSFQNIHPIAPSRPCFAMSNMDLLIQNLEDTTNDFVSKMLRKEARARAKM